MPRDLSSAITVVTTRRADTTRWPMIGGISTPAHSATAADRGLTSYYVRFSTADGTLLAGWVGGTALGARQQRPSAI